jgi:hypothetical protein
MLSVSIDKQRKRPHVFFKFSLGDGWATARAGGQGQTSQTEIYVGLFIVTVSNAFY